MRWCWRRTTTRTSETGAVSEVPEGARRRALRAPVQRGGSTTAGCRGRGRAAACRGCTPVVEEQHRRPRTHGVCGRARLRARLDQRGQRGRPRLARGFGRRRLKRAGLRFALPRGQRRKDRQEKTGHAAGFFNAPRVTGWATVTSSVRPWLRPRLASEPGRRQGRPTGNPLPGRWPEPGLHRVPARAPVPVPAREQRPGLPEREQPASVALPCRNRPGQRRGQQR